MGAVSREKENGARRKRKRAGKKIGAEVVGLGGRTPSQILMRLAPILGGGKF
jgi:hypothetical protein